MAKKKVIEKDIIKPEINKKDELYKAIIALDKYKDEFFNDPTGYIEYLILKNKNQVDYALFFSLLKSFGESGFDIYLKVSSNIQSSKSTYGLLKNSYLKSELYPMFGFTSERQMGALENLGLKKSPDTKNPNAIKPRVQYFREHIIEFLNSHALYAKNFDVNRKEVVKKKKIKG